MREGKGQKEVAVEMVAPSVPIADFGGFERICQDHKAVIQLDFCKGHQYTEKHNGSLLRKVIQMPSYLFSSGAAFV